MDIKQFHYIILCFYYNFTLQCKYPTNTTHFLYTSIPSHDSLQHRILHHRPANNCSVGLRSWCNTYCLQPYTALFVFVFMAATLHFSFFKGFYYNSPWSEREKWPFLKVPISLKQKRLQPPKLVCMHLTSIPTCMNFLS